MSACIFTVILSALNFYSYLKQVLQIQVLFSGVYILIFMLHYFNQLLVKQYPVFNGLAVKCKADEKIIFTMLWIIPAQYAGISAGQEYKRKSYRR